MSKQQVLERHGVAVSPKPLEKIAMPHANGAEPPHHDTAEATPRPVISVRDAESALDVARHELRLARDTLAGARATVAKRLTDYNRATPAITPEQNVRDWIASNNAARAERAAQRGHYQPTVTQTAKAMSGGGYGNDIRTRRGGGAAYRRGPGGVKAYTKAEAATANALRIREARAKLLPSER
jgi:hypothetical protein